MALHLGLEIFAAALGVVPIAALFLAWRRSRAKRLALGLTAFAVLEARLVAMILMHTFIILPHATEELVEFSADLAVILAFSAAFLYGVRWSPERARVKPA